MSWNRLIVLVIGMGAATVWGCDALPSPLDIVPDDDVCSPPPPVGTFVGTVEGAEEAPLEGQAVVVTGCPSVFCQWAVQLSDASGWRIRMPRFASRYNPSQIIPPPFEPGVYTSEDKHVPGPFSVARGDTLDYNEDSWRLEFRQGDVDGQYTGDFEFVVSRNPSNGDPPSEYRLEGCFTVEDNQSPDDSAGR